MAKAQARWRQRRWQVAAGLAFLAILGVLALVMVSVIAVLPGRIVAGIDPGTTAGAARLKAESDVRGSLVNIVTGSMTAVVAAAAGAVALLTFRETRRQNLASLDVTRRGQVTDRFIKAVDQLGNKQLAVRIGAIHALQQIAHDAPELRWQVIEVLTAFVRHQTPETSELANAGHPKAAHVPDVIQAALGHAAPDIQAVLTMLSNRDASRDATVLNLSGADLKHARLPNANLHGAALMGTQLQGANLIRANLQHALLMGANLEGTFLMGASLDGANLMETSVRGALFEGDNMPAAKGLTWEQLRAAEGFDEAVLPTYLRQSRDPPESYGSRILE